MHGWALPARRSKTADNRALNSPKEPLWRKRNMGDLSVCRIEVHPSAGERPSYKCIYSTPVFGRGGGLSHAVDYCRMRSEIKVTRLYFRPPGWRYVGNSKEFFVGWFLLFLKKFDPFDHSTIPNWPIDHQWGLFWRPIVPDFFQGRYTPPPPGKGVPWEPFSVGWGFPPEPQKWFGGPEYLWTISGLAEAGQKTEKVLFFHFWHLFLGPLVLSIPGYLQPWNGKYGSCGPARSCRIPDPRPPGNVPKAPYLPLEKWRVMG